MCCSASASLGWKAARKCRLIRKAARSSSTTVLLSGISAVTCTNGRRNGVASTLLALSALSLACFLPADSSLHLPAHDTLLTETHTLVFFDTGCGGAEMAKLYEKITRS